MPRPAWTPDEDALLRRWYPTGGVEACTPHLIDRTDGAIQARACALRVRLSTEVRNARMAEVVRYRAPYGSRSNAATDAVPPRSGGLPFDVLPREGALPGEPLVWRV